MNGLRNGLRALVIPLAMLLCGCAGSGAGNTETTAPAAMDKPAPVHGTSYQGTDLAECTILVNKTELAGNCTIHSVGSLLYVHWQTANNWMIEGVRLYAGTATPPEVVEYTDGIRELPQILLPSIEIAPVETGPISSVTLGTIEPVEIPTTLPLGLPYRNEDLAATEDLELVFSLEGCGMGDILYITCALDVSKESYSETATVVDAAGNELIIQQLAPHLNLPDFDIITESSDGGQTATYLTSITNIPAGYAVVGGEEYLGWCVDLGTPMHFGGQLAALYSSCDPNLPEYLQNNNWDMINYVINHKVELAEPWEIQQAIWYFRGGGGDPRTEAGIKMVEDALANGEGFIPGSGDKIAVIVDTAAVTQEIFIEVDVDQPLS